MRVSRVILGSTLLLAILSANIPSSVIASGSICTLTCCAGRAPHAAGSCMHGSCNAVLSTGHKTSKVHRVNPTHSEQFCGLSRRVVTKSVARLLVNRTPQPARSDPASAAAFVKPCQPDCGGCASGFANSNHKRNAATLAHAVRPRPPTDGLFDFASQRKQILNPLCRQGAPRGPPFSFS
jgi:hypothetical protein